MYKDEIEALETDLLCELTTKHFQTYVSHLHNTRCMIYLFKTLTCIKQSLCRYNNIRVKTIYPRLATFAYIDYILLIHY